MSSSRARVPALLVPAILAALSSTPVGAQPASAAPGTAAGSPSAAGGTVPGSPPAEKPRDSILVTGRGAVSGEPDTLTAHFAVETTAATVGKAQDGATTAATRMRDTLVHAGIARADLQTSNVGINPQRNDAGQITGYTASQGLTAKIRNLPRAGALMSAAIAAGGDAARLNGVSFAIEDDAALLAEARTKAFADARGKAELYAREAGRRLGPVVKVSEVAPNYGEPVEQQHRYAAADAAVPVEPGRQQLAVTVTVEWSLQPLPARRGLSRQP